MLKGEAMTRLRNSYFTRNLAPVQMLHTAGDFKFRGVASGSGSLFSWDNAEEHEWDAVSLRAAEGEQKPQNAPLFGLGARKMQSRSEPRD
jgi:hypothetical protein